MTRNRLAIFSILAAVTLFTTFYYIHDVLATCETTCLSWHTRTVTQTFTAPFQYRVLMPYTIEALSPVNGLADYLMVYTVAHLFVFGVMYGLLYNWLQTVHDRSLALVGVLMLAMVMSLVFRNSYNGAIYSPAEMALVTWGLWTLWRLPQQPRAMHRLFMLLIVAASLNRSTGILLPIAYVLMYGVDRQNWRRALLYGALSLGVFVALRWIIGPARMATPPERAMMKSLTIFLADTLMNNALLLPLWVLMLFGVQQPSVSPRLRRLVWLVPIYAVPTLYFGQWNEVRLWLSVFPVAIPLALVGLTVPVRLPERASTD